MNGRLDIVRVVSVWQQTSKWRRTPGWTAAIWTMLSGPTPFSLSLFRGIVRKKKKGFAFVQTTQKIHQPPNEIEFRSVLTTVESLKIGNASKQMRKEEWKSGSSFLGERLSFRKRDTTSSACRAGWILVRTVAGELPDWRRRLHDTVKLFGSAAVASPHSQATAPSVRG